MKLLILSKYNAQGPSSRYRFYNYDSYFKTHGLQVVYSPLLDGNYITSLYEKKRFKVLFFKLYGMVKRFFFVLLKSKGYDLIIIEKEMFPNCPYFMEQLLLYNRKYALDFDDYIAADYRVNKFKRFFLNNKIDRLVERANFVTVGNHWYFEEFKIGNLNYLPSVIDLTKYTAKHITPPNSTIVIVWIGSPSTAKYLEIVKPVLQELSKKHPFRLKVIGAQVSIEGVSIDLVKWDDATEFQKLLSSDIGIMPLFDSVWEKGKCGFKLIQYMASGLPVVASPAPANSEIIDQNISGFIADDQEAWFKYLEKLILDARLREQMGKEGRQKIERSYCYQVWGDRYVKMILDANS